MDKISNIKVDGSQISPNTINPYLFGHFVEDIRDHMDTMLAYELKDMDFEHGNIEGKGVSGSWYPITNGKNTIFALEPAAPRHTGHSQKIRIFSKDQCYAGIGQEISIRSESQYQFQFFARASLEIKNVTLEMIDRSTNEQLCSAEIHIESHDWREYKGFLSPERRCGEAEFKIMISTEKESWQDSVGTGMLWIDHVSILPTDSVGKVNKKVFDMTMDLNAGIMRIGGNIISAYHWEYGVGPEYERPIMLNEAWGTLTNKNFGTEEFLDFCNRLGVEPQICVNDGSGTPEEAANWVKYCNEDADTEMGAKRAANGHKDPYKVKYWEIGNEVWGRWQIGHCSAEEYAHRYVRFAKAMKAADPNIVLLACGHTDPEWNETVLEIAGEYIDYLTLHIYQGYNHFGFVHKEVPREQKYKAIVAFPEVTKRFLTKARGSLRNYDHVKLAVTEYNTMYYSNKLRSGFPNEHSLEAAVANAGNFNEFIRNSDILEIGNYSDLVNGWLGGCIRVGDNYADQTGGKKSGWTGKNDVIYGTPTYHVMKMYANRDIAYLVGSEVECDAFNVSSYKDNSRYEDLPELDVVPCINESKDLLTVFVVNRSLKETKLDMQFQNISVAGKARVGEVTGDDIDSINSVFEPENITCSYEDIEIDQQKLTYTLQAHSVYAFEIKGEILS